MNETLIVAVLSLLGTLIGTLGGIVVSNKLVNYRLQQLESKVQAHNNLVERTYHLESDMEVVHEQIKVVNHRIGDLEGSI
ncbi:MAG: hypothetical protein J6J43_06595 [Oscillospiraceae bacterium]|nr:hypothetical protein [Oscillospiraceae bacterium]